MTPARTAILFMTLHASSAAARHPLQTTDFGCTIGSPIEGDSLISPNMSPADANGAVGPTHLVSVVNHSITWSNKDGSNSSHTTLSGFFATGEFTYPFDPKVVYDQYNGRFVIIALLHKNSSSTIHIAVSNSSNPTGSWTKAALPSSFTISSNVTFADYPGIGIGDDAIFITTNQIYSTNTLLGQRLWVVPKGVGTGGFYDGDNTPSYASYDLWAATGLTADDDAQTLQPAHMFGAIPDSLGTFLVGIGWGSVSSESVKVVRVDDAVGTPHFTTRTVPVALVTNPGHGPQPGCGVECNRPHSRAVESGCKHLALGDGRLLNAVWRSNRLWTCHAAATECLSEPRFYEIRTDTVPTLVQQGAVDLEEGMAGFYPAIMTDEYGNATMCFGASSGETYAGAYFAYRRLTDEAGTMRSATAIAEGLATYDPTTSESTHRWGDYFGIALDPSTGAFWGYGQYAKTTATWGTRWGSIELPVVRNVIGVGNLGSMVLSWTSPVCQATSYDVRYSTSAITEQNWASATSVSGEPTPGSPGSTECMVITGLSSCTWYYFAVKATVSSEVTPLGDVAYRRTACSAGVTYSCDPGESADLTVAAAGLSIGLPRPNPAGGNSEIEMQIPSVLDGSRLEVTMLDVSGRRIAKPHNRPARAGRVVVRLGLGDEGQPLPGGIYFVEVRIEGTVAGRRSLVIR